MDQWVTRIKTLTAQYKYVLIVILAGFTLMLLPSPVEAEKNSVQPQSTVQPSMEENLEDILSKIQGVGKVQVLLTQAQGERTIYVYDEHSTLTGDTDSQQSDAVIITDSNRAQTGLVSQILPPKYQGAVVVCQGGDQPSVRLAVVEAVCDATGLSADKISVMKMK